MITTFYSFKGGVGRSMAVANTAWMLYRAGFRVIVVDMDLEAPGVDQFLASGAAQAERLRGGGDESRALMETATLRARWNERPGFIDLLGSYRSAIDVLAAATQAPTKPEWIQDFTENGRVKVRELRTALFESDTALARTLRRWLADRDVATSILEGFLCDVVTSDNGGRIAVMHAGRGSYRPHLEGEKAGTDAASPADESFASRVSALNWPELYRNYDALGFAHWLGEALAQRADYVLVDSRTGVTEHGGMAVMDLADLTLLLSAPNEQNKRGVLEMARAITSINGDRQRRRPRLWAVIPSRMDPSAANVAEPRGRGLDPVLESRLKLLNAVGALMSPDGTLPGESPIEKLLCFARERHGPDIAQAKPASRWAEHYPMEEEARKWIEAIRRPESKDREPRPRSIRYVPEFSIDEHIAALGVERDWRVPRSEDRAEERRTGVPDAKEEQALIARGYMGIADLIMLAQKTLAAAARCVEEQKGAASARAFGRRRRDLSAPAPGPVVWLHAADQDRAWAEILAASISARRAAQRIENRADATIVLTVTGALRHVPPDAQGASLWWYLAQPDAPNHRRLVVPLLSPHYLKQYGAWNPIESLLGRALKDVLLDDNKRQHDRDRFLFPVRIGDPAELPLEYRFRTDELDFPTPESLWDCAGNLLKAIDGLPVTGRLGQDERVEDPTRGREAEKWRLFPGSSEAKAQYDAACRALGPRAFKRDELPKLFDSYYRELMDSLDWEKTEGSARKWWLAFESENSHRWALIARLAIELVARKSTVTEFFLAYVYSNTDNIQANLHYLDYTRLKKQEEEKKKRSAEKPKEDVPNAREAPLPTDP